MGFVVNGKWWICFVELVEEVVKGIVFELLLFGV